MNNSLVRKLVAGLSLAAINTLVSRDNDIGCGAKTIESMNELTKIRASILNKTLDGFLSKHNDVKLKDDSFLHALSPDNIAQSQWLGIDSNIASTLENELNTVKDTINPEVRDLTEVIINIIGGGMSMNLLDGYNITMVKSHPLADMFKSGLPTGKPAFMSNVLEGGAVLNAKLPAATDMHDLKRYLVSSNPILNAQIESFLATQDDGYWIELYNSVFTSIKSNNPAITRLSSNRVVTCNDALFIYLFTRVYSKSLPFAVEGAKNEIVFTLEKLHTFVSRNLSISIDDVSRYENGNVVIVHRDGNDIMIAPKVMTANNITIEMVIASLSYPDESVEAMVKNKEKLETEFRNMSNLYQISQQKKLHSTYVTAYMEAFDNALSDIESYTRNRKYVYGKINSMPDTRISNVNDVVAKILCKFKYNHTNARFIYKKMKEYSSMFNTNEVDMPALSEYVALELVIAYLTTIHLEVLN